MTDLFRYFISSLSNKTLVISTYKKENDGDSQHIVEYIEKLEKPIIVVLIYLCCYCCCYLKDWS